MGRKGNRKPGSFAHDYDNLVVWNTHIDITEEQLDAICDAGEIQMNGRLRKQLKAELRVCFPCRSRKSAACWC